MQSQIAVQNLLQARFAELQRGNPRYSLRAFSRKVGIHVGALTYIINGKRNVSRTLAERIAQRLCLDPQERAELLGLFPERARRRAAGERAPGPRYLMLNASQFRIAAEWEHFAVLSLARCRDFVSDADWIARRLGVPRPRARQVVERLLELGLLALDAEGRLTRSEKSYRTTDETAEASLQRHHEQTLELARQSLERDEIETRDFTTLTMAIDPRKLRMAKERIRRFQDELSDLLESGDQTEVYRLSMQLIPLSKLNERETK